MTHSINQPWAISDKFRNRYGDIWADLDFVFNEKISAEVFREDPMNTKIGNLEIFNQKITLRYKDLIGYAKSINEKYSRLIAEKSNKSDVFPIEIKSHTFMLRCHEIGRLAETLSETQAVTLRSYELGLYL
jgi:hypothetical protein